MKEFDQLLQTTETLFGPNGCPWDRQQTMKSTRSCAVEEASELVDAIDLEDNQQIQEELGDYLFIALFLCKLAEKEERTTLSKVLHEVNEKLVRRHPHVFGEVKLKTSEQVVSQWAEIKQTEKGKAERKSALDGVPKGLPALSRADKVQKKFKKAYHVPASGFDQAVPNFNTEQELGELLYDIVAQAHEKGLEAEHALRSVLVNKEKAFREVEDERSRKKI